LTIEPEASDPVHCRVRLCCEAQLIRGQNSVSRSSAGHDGLTNAVYLAKGGLNVLAVEKNDCIGDDAVSRERHRVALPGPLGDLEADIGQRHRVGPGWWSRHELIPCPSEAKNDRMPADLSPRQAVSN